MHARTVRDALTEDHDRLDRLYATLQRAADTGADEATLRGLWDSFVHDLLRHMEVEELLLFPALGSDYDEPVMELVTEHGRLRALIDLIGSEVDMDPARAARAHRLMDVLHPHMHREVMTAYEAPARDVDERAYRKLVADIDARLAKR